MSKNGLNSLEMVSVPSERGKFSRFLNKNKFIFIAFAIPFLIMLAVFAINKIHPFGSKQMLVTDLWHQYYPFLVELQDKLQSGGSLLYSWSIGMGTNFISLMSYYLASPLNFLVGFIPKEGLRDALALFTIIKIGCAGAFMGMFLKHVYRKNDWSIPMFGSMFALCSFVAGYYWNVIWLDSLAIMPLVALGTYKLFKEGKYSMYVFSLALSIITNYYIGYMICIFTALYFIMLCITEKVRFAGVWKRFLRIAVFTIIALGLTAFITIPTFTALGLSSNASGSFPTTFTTYESYLDIFGNLTAFHAPTSKSGLPNLYCGFVCVLLVGYFLLSSKISVRDKITKGLFLLFIVVSCNVNVLNFIWHGFHFTNMIPYRFSFLFSFVLIIMAYQAFRKIDDMTLVDFIGMGVLGTTILLLGMKKQEKWSIIACSILAAVYLTIFFLRYTKILNKRFFSIALYVVIFAELCSSAYLGVKEVRVTEYSSYPEKQHEIKTILDTMGNNSDTDFYRMEMASLYTLNEPAIYGYNGVSVFSSCANSGVSKLMSQLNLLAGVTANKYCYYITSPVMNSFLNLRYIIDKNDKFGGNDFLKEEWDVAGVKVYQNLAYLPIGFMTENGFADLNLDGLDPFEAQNKFFSMATGLNENVFSLVEVSSEDPDGIEFTKSREGNYNISFDANSLDGKFRTRYTITEDNTMLYAIVESNMSKSVKTSTDNFNLGWVNIETCPYIYQAGNYASGETVTFESEISSKERKEGIYKIYVAKLNKDVFWEGFQRLSDEPFKVTKKTDTSLEGTIEVQQDGLLYTSIPYEKGWSLYVDGVKTDIEPLSGAFLSARLTEGEHTLLFKYMPAGFVNGAIISGGALLLFIALSLSRKNLWILSPDKIRKKKLSGKKASEQDFLADSADLDITAGAGLDESGLSDENSENSENNSKSENNEIIPGNDLKVDDDVSDNRSDDGGEKPEN